MKASDMVVIDLDGKIVDGSMRPSSDTPTHLALYRQYAAIGGIVHTHSTHATAWAQAGRAIPAFGTTHADYFHGAVPCCRALTREEVEGEYEANTGKVIIETIGAGNPMEIPGVLVSEHAPFALMTLALSPNHAPVSDFLLDKHYLRKHGANAYYGQK